MFRDHLHRARERARVLWLSLAGWRIYIAAFIIALPDILDGVAGVDVTALLPPWLPSSKFAAGLAVARIILRRYQAAIPAAPPAPPAEGPR